MVKVKKRKTWLLVVIITTVLSCLAIGTIGAKYYSQIFGRGNIDAAKFIINTTSGSEDLTLSPDKTIVIGGGEIAYAVYEFTVSNSESADNISEVAQEYRLGLALDMTSVQTLQTFLGSSTNIEFAPMLVATNYLSMTEAELIKLFTENVFPTGWVDESNFIEVYEENQPYPTPSEGEPFTPVELENANGEKQNYAVITFGSMQESVFNTASFTFNAGEAGTYKHYIIFTLYASDGTDLKEVLAETELEFSDLQILAYTEQLQPTN